jgi:hypothetical protein
MRNRSKLTAAIIGLALGLAVSTAAAQQVTLNIAPEAEGLIPREHLLGEWSAVVVVDTFPQPVRLRIKRVEPGETAGKMTYASPRRCVIDLEYGGPHEGRHIFYMVRFTDCFKYKKTDFVALSRVPEPEPEPVAPEPEPEAVELQQFKLGQTDKKKAAPPEPVEESTPAAPPDQILYAISLGGSQQESAILSRQ